MSCGNQQLMDIATFLKLCSCRSLLLNELSAVVSSNKPNRRAEATALGFGGFSFEDSSSTWTVDGIVAGGEIDNTNGLDSNIKLFTIYTNIAMYAERS
jgi:hypothetical protein